MDKYRMFPSTLDTSLKIKTPHLELREFQAADIADIQTYWDIPGFDKHIHLRFPSAQAAWDAYCEECASTRLRCYFVVSRENNVIGAVRLDKLPKDPQGLNLHLEMSPIHSGKGYMTEAAQAAIQWADETLDFTYMQATAHPGNVASQKVLDKLGFTMVEKRENYLRSHRGDLQDRLIYKRTRPHHSSP